MPKSNRPILWSRAAIGLGVVLALSASSASAIPYGCNPNALAAGEQFVGMAPGGPGIAPTPLCIFNEPPAAQGKLQGPPPRRYTREQVEAADRAIGEARKERAERAQAIRKKYSAGFWVVSGQDKEKAPCVAIFADPTGSVHLSGPRKGIDHATMMFLDHSIPSPADGVGGPVSVMLQQAEGAPVAAKALHYPGANSPGDRGLVFNERAVERAVRLIESSGDLAGLMDVTKKGSDESSLDASNMLLFAVPSVDAMVRGMIDTLRFRIVLDNEKVVDFTWKDGLVAAEALAKCQASKTQQARPTSLRALPN